MTHAFDVAALGSAIVDVLAQVDDDFLTSHNVAKGVMTLIDEPRAVELYEALGSTREVAGGSAANTIAGLASLGSRALFEGRVKDDRLGKAFGASMTGLGAQYTTKPATEGPSTAMCMIAVTPDGERSMSTYLGAAQEFCVDDINTAEIASSQVLYIEGYLWNAPRAKNACLAAIKSARQAGTKVAFTLADPFVVGLHRDEFRTLLDQFDIIFANEEEAKALFQAASFDAVLQGSRHWPGIAALTRSEKGCVIAKGDEVHVIDAYPVARVVDTTGAGDQFAAGFLYGITHGYGLADCGKLASLCAAEVISHIGARPEVSLNKLARDAGLL